MFDQLNDIIKSDSESQEKFNSIKSNFRKNTKENAKVAKRQARITAVILGLSTVVSLVFLIYAFNAQTQAEELQQEVARLELKLEDC